MCSSDLSVPTPFTGDHEANTAVWVGDHLLVGTLRGRVALVDPLTGQVSQQGESTLGTLRRALVSADQRLAVLDGTHGVAVWDLEAGDWITEVPAREPRALRLVGDELLIHDGTLRRWRLPTHATPTVVRLGGGVSGVAVAPSSERFAIATGDGQVRVLDAHLGGVLADVSLGSSVVKSVVFETEDSLAASGMDAGLVRLGLPRGDVSKLTPARSQRRLAVVPGGFLGADIHAGLFHWPSGVRTHQDRTSGGGS